MTPGRAPEANQGTPPFLIALPLSLSSTASTPSSIRLETFVHLSTPRCLNLQIRPPPRLHRNASWPAKHQLLMVLPDGG